MDTAILWRVAVAQSAAVAALSLLLGLLLPHGFFETAGWLVGPAAWLGALLAIAVFAVWCATLPRRLAGGAG